MKIAVIGGGAAGMACAVLLARTGKSVVLLERGERLGKKLSATGNGQGNITNVHMGVEHYRSDVPERVAGVLSRCTPQDVVRFFEDMGGVFLPDARGRVYPAGRQASAVTDLMRRELEGLGVTVLTGAKVEGITHAKDFTLSYMGGTLHADAVVLAAGGKAAKQFGTDGTAYALATAFGHTVTPLSPVLVQLRCDPAAVRGLKGIRVDALLTVLHEGREVYARRGDVLFTESGISGDAVFHASSHAQVGDRVLLDLLPDVERGRLAAAVRPGPEGLLCVVCNGLGRHIVKLAGGDVGRECALLKGLPLTVTGTLGFDYAQATRGGVPLREVTDSLESRLQRGLFFAGEILNVDGECGGYNLHWAWASAKAVAEALQ